MLNINFRDFRPVTSRSWVQRRSNRFGTVAIRSVDATAGELRSATRVRSPICSDHVSAVVAALVLALATFALDRGVAAADPDHSLVERVATAIENNNTRLGQFSAKTREEFIDHSVKSDAIKTVELETGAVLKRYVTPRQVTESTFFARGSELRCNRRVTAGASPAEKREFLFTDGAWMEYQPDIRTLWRRKPATMAMGFPFDPREIASFDLNRTLTSILREDSLVHSERIETSPDRELILLTLKSDEGRLREYTFDSSTGFLPIQSTLRFPGGAGGGWTTVLSYTLVRDASAHFLEHAELNIYPTQQDLDDVRPSQEIRLTVEDFDGSTPLSDDVFKLAIPAGVAVNDGVSNTRYVTGSDQLLPGGDRHESMPWYYWIAVAAPIAAFAFYIFKRRAALQRRQ